MTTILRAASIAIIGMTLAACGGGGAGSSGGTDAPEPASAALSHVADCDALLATIRDDARRKIAVQADELRAGGWAYTGIGQPYPQGSSTPAGAAPTPAPTAGGAPPPFTDTNTQVPGVDEADVVETDGTRIYLLRNDRLLVLNAQPPEASTVVEQVTIEGAPLGMFVAGGRGLVVSSVYDFGPLGGDSFCGAIGEPFPPLDTVGGALPHAIPPFCESPFVKVTLLDLTTTPARVARELYVEGTYVAARRHDSRARVIVQRTWGTPVDLSNPWSTIWSGGAPASEAELATRIDAWEREALAAIDASSLADWLPTARERVNGTLREHALTCDQAAAPPPGQASSGGTLIVGLDLASDDGAISDTLVVGGASQIYANADTLVLAQPEWQSQSFEGADTRTALHVFGLAADGLTPVYRGSGFVPGTVPSQFGLDVRGDVVRTATTFVSASDSFPQLVTRVTTAQIADGALVRLGASVDLAPGESLRGVRFVDDLAYLVTFLQIDPLFVIDLSDPTNPHLLGELELPGFSTYLHPLDGDHFLTIGQAADEQGRPTGPALRVFDVADPTAPRLTAEYVLPLGAYTPAEYNHLAFTLDPQRGLLALPVNLQTAQGATLQLFDVSVTAGIAARGVIAHGDAGFAPCEVFPGSCQIPEYMERGLLIGDAVYSLSNRQMQVHGLDDLATALATVPLP